MRHAVCDGSRRLELAVHTFQFEVAGEHYLSGARDCPHDVSDLKRESLPFWSALLLIFVCWSKQTGRIERVRRTPCHGGLHAVCEWVDRVVLVLHRRRFCIDCRIKTAK